MIATWEGAREEGASRYQAQNCVKELCGARDRWIGFRRKR